MPPGDHHSTKRLERFRIFDKYFLKDPKRTITQSGGVKVEMRAHLELTTDRRWCSQTRTRRKRSSIFEMLKSAPSNSCWRICDKYFSLSTGLAIALWASGNSNRAEPSRCHSWTICWRSASVSAMHRSCEDVSAAWPGSETWHCNEKNQGLQICKNTSDQSPIRGRSRATLILLSLFIRQQQAVIKVMDAK